MTVVTTLCVSMQLPAERVDVSSSDSCDYAVCFYAAAG